MVNTKLNNAIRLIALIILLGVVVYIYFLSTSEDSIGLKEKISGLSLNNFIIPTALSLLSYFLRFIRWRLILKQFGHSVSIKVDLICYLSGFALTMTPGKSGETIRSAFLLQAQVPFQTSLSAFVIERSFDLLIVGLLATLITFPPIFTLLLFLASLMTISFVGSRLANSQLTSSQQDTSELAGSQLTSSQLTKKEQQAQNTKLPRLLLRLLNLLGQASIVLKPKPIATYALLGCAAWTAQGLGFYYIVCIFTQDIGLLDAISTYCAGLFIGAVSLIPGGIGVTEGSLSWLLQTQGLDQNSAILSALISRVCTLWLAVAIGCFSLAVIIKGNTTHKKIKPKQITDSQNSEGS